MNRPYRIARCFPGRFMNRPYGFHDSDDAVNMIWHQNKLVDFNVWITPWQMVPIKPDHFADFIRLNFTFYHLTKQMLFLMSANCNEICSRLRIIVSGQPDRSPVMDFRVVGHIVRANGERPDI